MPDNPVNEVNLSTVLALLTELDRKMREGFAALTHEQKVLPEDRQALSKRMKDGFAAVAQEQRALREDQQTLSKRMEDGFASEARERQTLAKELENLTNWLHKEIPENAHILSRMIERVQAEFAEFKREKSVQDKDVLQRLNRLETVRSLN